MNVSTLHATALSAAILTALPAHASQLGGFPGRTVNAEENNQTSVEAYYKSADGTGQGLRASYRYNPDILLFVDATQLSLDNDEVNVSNDLEGNAFGIGLMYFRPDLVDGYDAAFSVSYHTADFETGDSELTTEIGNDTFRFSGIEFESEVTEITAQLIISSRTPLAENGLLWYAGAGVHRISVDSDFQSVAGQDVVFNGQNVSQAVRDASDTENELGITAGLVLPTSFGHVYAAAESIDGRILGVGLRYHLK